MIRFWQLLISAPDWRDMHPRHLALHVVDVGSGASYLARKKFCRRISVYKGAVCYMLEETVFREFLFKIRDTFWNLFYGHEA